LQVATSWATRESFRPFAVHSFPACVPRELDIDRFQRSDVDIGLRRDLSGSGTPKIPAIRFTRGMLMSPIAAPIAEPPG
jgi:hypothetical protein